MPSIPSSALVVNRPVEVAAPDAIVTITVDPAQPLKPGSYLFQLEVEDDSGNRSEPARWKVVVLDEGRPTAVISGPEKVKFRQEFTLSGKDSHDAEGKIAKYIWTLLG